MSRLALAGGDFADVFCGNGEMPFLVPLLSCKMTKALCE
jgi:hypothetical protein